MTDVTANKSESYAQGDWVVHCYHGIGQIESMERKHSGHQKHTYFRIKTADSVIWLPADQTDVEQLRPIADEERFQDAVVALEKPPEQMPSNLNKRKARIKQVLAGNTPKETACLIRDLRARRRKKQGLNQSERQALRDLTKRFLQEWSVCKGLTMRQARKRLNRQLRKGRAATQGHPGNGQENEKRESFAFLEALARKDDKWSDWLNRQLVKGI